MQTAADQTFPTDCAGRAIDLVAVRERLAPLSAQDRLHWAQDTFGEGFALTTSFGIQSAVLLHMVSELGRQSGLLVKVIWVDTGYLPPETYQYADQLAQRLHFKLVVVQATMSPARMEAIHGRLWDTKRVDDLELYHRIRKVEPLDQALTSHGITCWASGVRGSQTDHRRAMELLDQVRQRWTLRPLLSWTKRDIYYYMEEHQLPQHPLFEQGYSTVGDWHSSAPDAGAVSGRATRFGGLQQECGIHLPGLMGEGI
ncbi:MAG: phosphoadenylyl-sulfate reductase [Cyanobium sp.]